MAWNKDVANRLRWSADQKAKASAAMADQRRRDEAEKLEGLRRMLAACALDPQLEASFGASVRAQIASLEATPH